MQISHLTPTILKRNPLSPIVTQVPEAPVSHWRNSNDSASYCRMCEGMIEYHYNKLLCSFCMSCDCDHAPQVPGMMEVLLIGNIEADVNAFVQRMSREYNIKVRLVTSICSQRHVSH
jgi:hypothetical protein